MHHVSKSYSSRPVIENLSLEFVPGELTLLLGRNGVGKSTLLRMCVGLSRPDSGLIGRVDVDGMISHVPSAELGYASHSPMLYSHLTVRENLALFAAFYGAEAGVSEALERWDLRRFEDRLVSELSKGVQLRLSLCRVSLISPTALFLDEPTSALDEHSVSILLGELTRMNSSREGGTVMVIATHDLTRLLPHAGRVIVLDSTGVAHDTRFDVITAGVDTAREQSREFYLQMNR